VQNPLGNQLEAVHTAACVTAAAPSQAGSICMSSSKYASPVPHQASVGRVKTTVNSMTATTYGHHVPFG
jgi:hypothetical protein